MNPYEIEDFQLQPGFESTGFTTDSGVKYYVYFKDISAGGVRIHSFGFEPIGYEMDDDFPHDHRIDDTIAKIVDVFFCGGRDMIVYYPHNDDKRRLRLFNFWFYRHLKKLQCGEIDKDSVTFRYDTNTEITICVIFKPHCKEIAQQILYGNDLGELWDNKS